MRAHLGGSSRKSLVTARGALEMAVKGATSADASALSSELFFIAEVLDSNIAIRRAVTDISRTANSKSVLLTELFTSKIGALALGLITEVSGLRWSASKDLVQVVEGLAIEAEASAANIDGELDRVEGEIFAASRAIAGSTELRKAITSDASEAKAALVKELLKEATSSTIKLVSQLATSWRGRSIESAFSDYQYALAARRNRTIALVRVAAPITLAQEERLVALLSKEVGQPVRVNIEIDPSTIGGVSVKFADELVDGSISNRLANAGRALAGIK